MIYMRWHEEPIVMNLDDKLAEIHEIPFPAVRVYLILIQIACLISLLYQRHRSKRPSVCLLLHLIIGIFFGLLGHILQIYFGDYYTLTTLRLS
jgi:hypothetical protein